jgi:hypothetical protein
MEALNRVFCLVLQENTSQRLVGVFSSSDEARKEIEKSERRGELFYIQEREINTVCEPSYEIEVKYCPNGHKSEMIVTRNSIESIN